MRRPLQLGIVWLVCLILVQTQLSAQPIYQWTNTYDGGAAYLDENNVALTDPAGHLVVGGESYDGIDGSDMLIRKLDRLTQVPLWSVRYPAFDGNDMALTDMVWDGFGNIVVAGYIRGCLG